MLKQPFRAEGKLSVGSSLKTPAVTSHTAT